VADRGRCGRVVRGNALDPLQPEHPARLKLAHEPTDGKRMRVRLTGALLRGRVPQEHDGADDFRAPLDGVHNVARG
jgi:hypothetical protein